MLDSPAEKQPSFTDARGQLVCRDEDFFLRKPENDQVTYGPVQEIIQHDSKSLIELFTGSDAVTGRPASRWVSLAGLVPEHHVLEGNRFVERTAKHVLNKSGKLGNGNLSPDNNYITSTGHPVSVVSGETLLEQVDFILPGPIPLVWRRVYRTSHSKDFGLGVGWTSVLFSRLDLRENEIVYCNGEGREIPFDRIPKGESCFNAMENLTLFYDEDTVYRIVDDEHRVLTFGGTAKRRRLYEIADREGHAIKMFYSASDLLIQILDSAGRRIKFDYNISGQLQRASLCNDDGDIVGKPLVEYSYNDERDLTKVTDANGNSQSYDYRYHIMIKRTTKDGFSFHFEWDEYTIKGRCTRMRGDGNIYNYQFKYDQVNKITRSINSRGNTTEYHYNDLGLITTKIDPEGGVTQFIFDEQRRLLKLRTPTGQTTQNEYNQTGKLVRRVDALGNQTLFEYDNADNLVQTSDALEQTWRFEYDNKNRLIAAIGPNDHTQHYHYTEKGQLSSVTGSGGVTQEYQWNDKGELLKHIDALGNETRYSYDELGRVIKAVYNTTDAQERSTHYSYDRMGNITQVIQPNGASYQMQYTADGHLTQYIDIMGRSTRYKYDGLSEPVERIDPDGRRFKFEYDKERNLAKLLNENGETHQFEYDKNDRLIEEIGYDGRVQKYNYNASGELVRHLDGAHRVTSFKRDLLGRLVQKRTSTGEITQYEYDPLGRLIKVYNSRSMLHFRYNAYGQLIGEMQNGQRIQYKYNDAQQRTHTILPDGNTIRYDYDEKGSIKQLSYAGAVLAKIQHNELGLEIFRSCGEITSQFEYDAMHRLTQQRSTVGQHLFLERRYRYDKASLLRHIEDELSGKSRFQYDSLDRLIVAEGLIGEKFTFDPTGNLLDPEYPEPKGYVQGNRLRVFQHYRFEYDDVGNLVRQFHENEETRFYYNVANQLARVNKNGQTFEYTYDPLGRRISKSDSGGQTTYLWDGNVLIQELRNDATVTYVSCPDNPHPICQIRNNKVYYYHQDHAGTPYLITNAAGEIVWQALYKAHGSVHKLSVEKIDNNIRFRGHYHDSESGLHYTLGKFYHPATGRFIHQNCAMPGRDNNCYAYPQSPGMCIDPMEIIIKPEVSSIKSNLLLTANSLASSIQLTTPSPLIRTPINNNSGVPFFNQTKFEPLSNERRIFSKAYFGMGHEDLEQQAVLRDKTLPGY